MNLETQTSSSQIVSTVDKFYLLNDDLDATQAVARKMFFEFLRTKPSLSTDEIETIQSFADLLAELCKVKRAGNA